MPMIADAHISSLGYLWWAAGMTWYESNMLKTKHQTFGAENLKMLSKHQKSNKEEKLKGTKRFLTSRIIVTNIGHMIFIMLEKKSPTAHLLLTNPTAVLLNDDRSCVSSFSLSFLCSIYFTWFRAFWQTFVFLGKCTWLFLGVDSFMLSQVSR